MRALSHLRPLCGSQLSLQSIEHAIEDPPLPLIDRGAPGKGYLEHVKKLNLDLLSTV